QLSLPPITNPGNLITNIAPLTGILIALTLCELLMSRRLPSLRNTETNKKFLLQPYITGRYLKKNCQLLTKNRLILIAILGLSLFWATSQALLAVFPAFAKATLTNDNTIISQGVMACTAIGLIIGTLTAGKLSKKTIELRLVPIAAFGLALMIGVLPQLKTPLSMALIFTIIGLLGGLFIVPLLALIQFHAHSEELGTVLAGNNWIQNIIMVMFLGLTILLAHIGVNSIQLFYGLMTIALLGATYMLYEFSHTFNCKNIPNKH
ncbi:MAG TPA: MFS transporter, partial [Cellvibrio sp.]|nr:MFS transporter [Cellvibrio sp.]